MQGALPGRRKQVVARAGISPTLSARLVHMFICIGYLLLARMVLLGSTRLGKGLPVHAFRSQFRLFRNVKVRLLRGNQTWVCEGHSSVWRQPLFPDLHRLGVPLLPVPARAAIESLNNRPPDRVVQHSRRDHRVCACARVCGYGACWMLKLEQARTWVSRRALLQWPCL